MIFIYDEQFAATFSLPVCSGKRFYTHAELDEFVVQLKLKCPQFSSQYRGEYKLLKGFDRAFWMQHRHKKTKENAPKQPCPFKNPSLTYSLPPQQVPVIAKKHKRFTVNEEHFK